MLLVKMAPKGHRSFRENVVRKDGNDRHLSPNDKLFTKTSFFLRAIDSGAFLAPPPSECKKNVYVQMRNF